MTSRLFYFSVLRFPVFFPCGLIYILWFIQCRNVDLMKRRTLVNRSDWIRSITEWIIRVGLWITSFRWWLFLLLSNSITFLRLFILSRSKHRRWSSWNNTLNYLVVESMWYKAHFHNQLNMALIWSRFSHRNMKENNGNFSGWRTSNWSWIIKLGPNKTVCRQNQPMVKIDFTTSI